MNPTLNREDRSSSSSSLRSRRSKSSVLVIYTGGTVGMVKDEKTHELKPSGSYLKKSLLDLCAKLDETFPEVSFVELEELMDSSDMEYEDWKNICLLIEDAYYNYDGFVVIMGTDTMAYASSGISFMLTNLAKPVVFTGAMLPMANPHSDAVSNLLLSIEIAAFSNIPEVMLFFHNRLFRGNRAVKVKSNAMDAFDSPNLPPLAVSGVDLRFNEEIILKTPRNKHLNSKFKVNYNFDLNILVIRLVPGFDDRPFKALLNSYNNPENPDLVLKGLVLQLYGTGNAPGAKKGLVSALKSVVDTGVVVAICSQCLSGEVNLGIYAAGNQLREIGAISTIDMTVEATTAKLGFLLGQGLPNSEVKRLLSTNIRGELSGPHERSTV
eukprot:maker-scaffold_3-snap-gene-4.42-mRNA-1 protein AED:0.03 eAED:0.03 QI:184/1/1/1/1/1/5/396/380